MRKRLSMVLRSTRTLLTSAGRAVFSLKWFRVAKKYMGRRFPLAGFPKIIWPIIAFVGFSGIVSIAGMAYFIFPRLGKTIVLVKTLSLPERYVRAGYSPSVFTEDVIATVQTVIRRRETEGIATPTIPRSSEKRTHCLDHELFF